MLTALRKAYTRHLLKQGWTSHEIVAKSLVKLPARVIHFEASQRAVRMAQGLEDQLKQKEQMKSPESNADYNEMIRASDPIIMLPDSDEQEKPFELVKEEIDNTPSIPDFIERDGFYDDNVTGILEMLSKETGISYNFFKQRFLVGDGCCWVCGGRLKDKKHFFCPWHNVDFKEESKTWDDKLAQRGLTLERIGRWSLDHVDFKLPQEFLCPKCEDRPHAAGDYLCDYCRGRSQ